MRILRKSSACSLFFLCLSLSFVIPTSLRASGPPLFPKPLHLTREIADPVSGRTTRVEEYYFANRVITIRGTRTVIADYESKQVTEVDRANGTYSITAFDDLARARSTVTGMAKSTAKTVVERKGSDRRAGRAVDVFTAADDAGGLHAEIAIDSSVDLSRDAFDIVVGAAHPDAGGVAADMERAAAHREIARVQSTAAVQAESYGLPLDVTLRWDNSGTTIELVNRVMYVGEESAPPDLLAIPPGARRIDSHAIQVKRASDSLDSITPSKPAH